MAISFVDAKTENRCGPNLRLESGVETVAWSSTAEHIVTLTEDGILRKWSNIFHSATIVAEAEHAYAYSLEFSPDDKLFVSSGEYVSKLFRASDLSLVWEHSGGRSPAFHPMGHRLFLFGIGVDSVFDVNIEDLENITATEHNLNFWVDEAVFDPSGNTFAARTDQEVKILDANTFEEKSSLPYGNVRGMRFTPDGKYLLVVLNSKMVVLWDVAAGYAIEKLMLDLDSYEIYFAEISKSYHMLLLECNDSTIYTVQLESTCYY
jgi:WD40 repeat protein